jgi:hypothetical protein
VLTWTKKGVAVLEVLEVTITGLGALKLRKGATAKKPTCMDPEQKIKTYNRRDSQMVTHSSTSRPVQCLCMAERTGCPVLTDLWSYVLVTHKHAICTKTK